jgi:hypothetical protein
MKKKKLSNYDELTEKMHSEFTISKETELKIKVMIAKEDMKEFSYSVSEICELYDLTEEELGIDKNN